MHCCVPPPTSPVFSLTPPILLATSEVLDLRIPRSRESGVNLASIALLATALYERECLLCEQYPA